MNTVLKYPGAKNRLAPWIVSFIPNHDVYLEPFFGSGAVFFNKKPCRIETINDIHDDVVNYFKILRDRPYDLINVINLTPYARTEYNTAYQSNDTDAELEKARKFCVRCWQGFGASNVYRNGFRSGQQSNSPNLAKAWSKLPVTLVQATERLRDVQIECLDVVELIKRYDTKDVFIYLDPPYLTELRKPHLYKYEMNATAHIDMLNVLRNHKAKILISGYDNELYNEMLKGWHKEYKRTVAEKGKQRVECLWMNYENQPTLF